MSESAVPATRRTTRSSPCSRAATEPPKVIIGQNGIACGPGGKVNGKQPRSRVCLQGVHDIGRNRIQLGALDRAGGASPHPPDGTANADKVDRNASENRRRL